MAYLSPDELAAAWSSLPKRLLWARMSCNRPLVSALASAGARRETLNAWEQGREEPTWDQVRTLARIYDVTDDFLLFNETREPPEVLHRNLDNMRPEHAQAAYIEIAVARTNPLPRIFHGSGVPNPVVLLNLANGH